MIQTIILEDFMAHERTELELGPGVTALTGANNTGKSAIVEALRCVTTNPSMSHCIRHGAKEARVTVIMDDGAKVVWIRKKRSAGYEITLPGRDEPEEPFWKLQGKVPDEVRALLRLDQVELETGRSVDVHVGNQREPVFLLNRPDSDAAAFFAASTESAHLLAMQNVLKRRTTDAKRRERELEDRLAGIEARLDGLAELPAIGLRMERAQELESTARRLQAETPRLEEHLATVSRLARIRDARRQSATILKSVEPVPNLNHVDGLAAVVRGLDSLSQRMNAARDAGAALAGLGAPPATEDTRRLAVLCDDLRKVSVALRKTEERNGAMTGLDAPPDRENTSHLSELIDELIALRCRVDRLSRWEEVLRTVAEPPALAQDTRLESLVADIRGLAARRAAGEAALAALESELRTVRDTLAARLEELGACPTCGAKVDAQSFLERRHAHDR
jgi:ATPase involved in DNA repair